MKHLSDEDLILHFYREDADAEGVESHLQACDACREGYRRLSQDLASVSEPPLPFRGADYGSQVWARVAPKLAAHGSGTFWSSRTRWTFALAASLMLAFLAGRIWERDSTPHLPGIDSAGKQRVLATAAVDHLERAEVLLMDVSRSSADPEDIRRIRTTAEGLLIDNRLLRLSSEQAEDWRLMTVLDELERKLLDLAHVSESDGADWVFLREQIESGDLTFKVRAVGYQLRQKELERARQLARTGS